MKTLPLIWTPSLLFAMTLGCASAPRNTVSLPPGSEISSELSKTEQMDTDLKNQNADVLDAKDYKKFQDSLADAQTDREKGKNDKGLKELARAQGFALDAKQQSENVRPQFAKVLESRQFAMQAGAPAVMSKPWSKADDELKDLSSDVKSGASDRQIRKIDDLNAAYMHLEAQSLITKNLGPIEKEIEQARKDKAETYAPRTLKETESRFLQSSKAIEGSPRNAQVVQTSTDEAKMKADQLVLVMKIVRGDNYKTTEEVALRQLNLQAQLNKTSTSLDRQRTQNENLESQRNSAEQRAAEMSAAVRAERNKKTIEDKAQEIRKNFDPQDAEVSTVGNNQILIRMKGLKFPSNQANLTTAQYPLMGKLKESITAVGAQKVMIEGHTDAAGSAKKNEALSEKRAESVKSYLASIDDLKKMDIEAQGFGFTKPIADNKTAAGRAANRRIDVILQTQSDDGATNSQTPNTQKQ